MIIISTLATKCISICHINIFHQKKSYKINENCDKKKFRNLKASCCFQSCHAGEKIAFDLGQTWNYWRIYGIFHIRTLPIRAHHITQSAIPIQAQFWRSSVLFLLILRLNGTLWLHLYACVSIITKRCCQNKTTSVQCIRYIVHRIYVAHLISICISSNCTWHILFLRFKRCGVNSSRDFPILKCLSDSFCRIFLFFFIFTFIILFPKKRRKNKHSEKNDWTLASLCNWCRNWVNCFMLLITKK